MGYEDAVPIPFAGWVNASPPHIVDSGASVMNNEPVAYINVEERKLEWAKPTTWHTPTIAQMDKIPLYIIPNTEPVAWMSNGKEFYVQKNYCPDFIPLYTHPAKTLTEDTECQYCKQGCIRCDARKLLTDEEIIACIDESEPDTADMIRFARAILRKAQEK